MPNTRPDRRDPMRWPFVASLVALIGTGVALVLAFELRTAPSSTCTAVLAPVCTAPTPAP